MLENNNQKTINNMAKYRVKLNYRCSIVVEVEANDEGDALHKGREFAEAADMSQFALGIEDTTQCECIGD